MSEHEKLTMHQYMRQRITDLESENRTLKEAYERDCTPAYEEVCLRNEKYHLLLSQKQQLLEKACEEHGHDWRGDGERCARCGISDHLAQYTPDDSDPQVETGASQ